MTNVIPIPRCKHDGDDKHLTGRAHCLTCKHQWIGVAPVGTAWLDCPECGSGKGRWHTEVYPGDWHEVWECRCECRIFHVTRTCIVCIDCGLEQSFP